MGRALRPAARQCAEAVPANEVFMRIHGKLQYLWRAVDQDGHVLDILVQSRRNAKTAKRFFRKLLKSLQYAAGDRDGQVQELRRCKT
jgi:putative transposase